MIRQRGMTAVRWNMRQKPSAPRRGLRAVLPVAIGLVLAPAALSLDQGVGASPPEGDLVARISPAVWRENNPSGSAGTPEPWQNPYSERYSPACGDRQAPGERTSSAIPQPVGFDCAVFTVNTKENAPDAIPGDGRCETAPGNEVCSLRAALEEARALPGVQVVRLPEGHYSIGTAER